MTCSKNKIDIFHKIFTRCTAPTLKYLKPSSLVCLPQELKADNIKIISDKLEMQYMYKYNKCEFVFIYNRKMLEELIKQDEIFELLSSYSYPQDQNLDLFLEHLKNRLTAFTQAKTNYPHEIGLFLGYPYLDVKDFITKSENCCFSGYWKVYNNPFKAKKIMQDYTNAKEQVLSLESSGQRYYEITGI